MRILGIDFGLKKIGLAINENFLVEPLGVIKNLRQIPRVCQEQKIEKIVIGISEGEIAKKTKEFGRRLRRMTGLPVVYQDETLSSQEARELMIEIDKPQKKRQEEEHAIVAALILRHYLIRQSSSS